MSRPTIEHRTISLSRRFAAPVERVYAAVADPIDRQRVLADSSLPGLTYQQTDLRVGGRDAFSFSDDDGVRHYRGETHYHDIVPEYRVLFTEVVSEGERRLWIGLTSFEFKAKDRRTLLLITAHIAWLDDAGEADGCDGRYAALLDDIERHLSGR
jgi:uncharacterized protein YndB with AHSA1/START domain